MKKILFSVLALGAMTGAALAEPQKMDEAQMAGVAAGQVDVSNDITNTATSAAVALNGGTATSQAYNTNNLNNEVKTFDIVLPPLPNGNGDNGDNGMATSGSFDLDLGDLGVTGAVP